MKDPSIVGKKDVEKMRQVISVKGLKHLLLRYVTTLELEHPKAECLNYARGRAERDDISAHALVTTIAEVRFEHGVLRGLSLDQSDPKVERDVERAVGKSS